MTFLCGLFAVTGLTVSADAQPAAVVARDGWEAFPQVEYQGGDATQPKKRWGILVLTDSTLAFHECFDGAFCPERKGKLFKEPAIFTAKLTLIQEIGSSTQVRGASATGKIAFGILANDRREEFLGFVYESATSAEAPVFKTLKTQAAAIEAKVKFRLKKLGVMLPPGL